MFKVLVVSADRLIFRLDWVSPTLPVKKVDTIVSVQATVEIHGDISLLKHSRQLDQTNLNKEPPPNSTRETPRRAGNPALRREIHQKPSQDSPKKR